MRSLFLKILLSSFLTVIFIGFALAMTFAVMIPSGGQFKFAASFLPILSIGISGLICFLLTRHITSPLFELRRGAETIAAGNLTARVPGDLRNRRGIHARFSWRNRHRRLRRCPSDRVGKPEMTRLQINRTGGRG